MDLKRQWVETFYRVSTGSRKIRCIFTPIGATFYGLLVFAFVIIAVKLDKLTGLANIFPHPLNIILSIPLFSLALLLIGWSLHHFLLAKGTPVPFNPPPRLVTTGPYAYTRNPMLTGVFSLLFGFSMWFGSAFLLLVFTPLFILMNIWELKFIEEPELEKRLGEEYVTYRKKTPMFLPDVKTLFGNKE